MRNSLGILLFSAALLANFLVAQVVPEVRPAEIQIETEPGARIYLDDKLAGVVASNGRFVIRAPKPGTRSLEIHGIDKRPFTKQIKVVEGETSRLTAKLEGYTGDLEILTAPLAEVAVDGKRAAGADSTGRALIRNLTASRKFIVEHSVRVSADGYSPEERKIQVQPDSVITITIELLRVEASAEPGSPPPAYAFHRRLPANTIYPSICFSTDSRRLLTAGDDVAILWDPGTGRQISKREIPWSNGRSSISADLRWLVVPIKSKGEVHVYDVESGSLARKLTPHKNAVVAHLSPDGRHLYSLAECATDDKGACKNATTAVLWNFETGQPLRTWENGGGPVAFSSDGNWLAEEVNNDSASSSTILLRQLMTAKPVRQFTAESPNFDLYFTPDSRWIALRNSGRVELYEASTGRQGRRFFLADNTSPSGIAFTPDSRFMAGANGDIVLWEIASGRIVSTLKVPGNDVRTVAVSPDGRWIAGGSTGYLTLFRRVD